MIELIGGLAGVVTTGAILPQILKVLHTKSVADLSIVYYSILLFGFFLWFTYGALIVSWPLMVANGVGITLHGMLIVTILRYGNRR